MVRRIRKRICGLIPLKKLVYLISPSKIDQNFYSCLDKVLSFKNVRFFQLRLKNVSQKKLINISKKIKKITKTPIVAIGGINSENYKKLLLNKANFLAISGYIWNNKKQKPLEAIEKLR